MAEAETTLLSWMAEAETTLLSWAVKAVANLVLLLLAVRVVLHRLLTKRPPLYRVKFAKGWHGDTLPTVGIMYKKRAVSTQHEDLEWTGPLQTILVFYFLFPRIFPVTWQVQ